MKTFNFCVEEVRRIPVSKERVIENIIDFDHVNYVHKRCYAYCRVVDRWKTLTLLEYGVYHIPGLPWVTHYTMLHEFQPPDTVVHLARSGKMGPWTRTVMQVSEFQTPSGSVTEYRHFYERPLPIWMKPLTPLLRKWVRRWTDILWEEDSGIVKRRHEMVQNGFRESTSCARWVYEHGTGVYRFD